MIHCVWCVIVSQVALSEAVRRLLLCECRRHVQRTASPASAWSSCASSTGQCSYLFISMSFQWDMFCYLYISAKTESPCLLWSSELKVAQSCLTLCDPVGYPVHEILQARILEWVAFPFSRGSSQPRDQIQVFRIAGGFSTSWVTRKGLVVYSCI